MRTLRLPLFLVAVCSFGSAVFCADGPAKPTPTPTPVPSPGAKIRVNSIGFAPSDVKLATIATPAKTFRLVNMADGKVAFTGKPGAATKTDRSDTDETVQVADFTAFGTPGRYTLETDEAGRSAEFTIGKGIWNTPFEVVLRGMYLWRCGTEAKAEWNGRTFSHAACHLEDGWLDHVGGGHTQKTSTGGWHDAGDYNKYVVNAGVTVGLMFKALEHFPERISAVNTGIPESGNTTPDLLDEIRWELEWLFTMQLEDGRVLHKLSSPDFRYWGPSEGDRDPRFFCSWSTVATADFTAMMACAARHFRRYDPVFGARCLRAARLGWSCLTEHPQQVNPDLKPFKTGGYDPKDWSARLWAAAELWETTGENPYLIDFERRASAVDFNAGGPGWGDVEDLGLATYLLSKHTPDTRNRKLVQRLQKNLRERADAIVATADKNAHGRPFGVERKHWFWGCNGNVAGQTFLLHVADKTRPDPRYRQTALLALGHLFGRNYHGRSYVTGLGANPPLHPHDRRGEPAWPGYLVGGGWPDGRGWVDETRSYERNEIAINWNGALIYALAAFVEPAPPASGVAER